MTEQWDPLGATGIPVPRGFLPYSNRYVGWRNRVGDTRRDKLSLTAEGHDISGLAEVGPHSLWRLDIRRRRVDDAAFDVVCRFDQLEELDASSTQITDRAVEGMHTLQALRWLSLSHCKVTNAAMEHLAGLRRLEHLDISATAVTDDGLRALAFHPTLRVLNIRDSHVTGEALAPLVTLPELRQLWVTRQQHRQAKHFHEERPEVEILS